jgi:hypothetical protein
MYCTPIDTTGNYSHGRAKVSISQGRILKLLIFLCILFGVPALLFSNWPDSEERRIRAKYEIIMLGGTLEEAETALRMPRDILQYSGDNCPETLEIETLAESPAIPWINCYLGDRYAIVLYYDLHKKRVTGKELLLLKNRWFTRYFRWCRAVVG